MHELTFHEKDRRVGAGRICAPTDMVAGDFLDIVAVLLSGPIKEVTGAKYNHPSSVRRVGHVATHLRSMPGRTEVPPADIVDHMVLDMHRTRLLITHRRGFESAHSF